MRPRFFPKILYFLFFKEEFFTTVTSAPDKSGLTFTTDKTWNKANTPYTIKLWLIVARMLFVVIIVIVVIGIILFN